LNPTAVLNAFIIHIVYWLSILKNVNYRPTPFCSVFNLNGSSVVWVITNPCADKFKFCNALRCEQMFTVFPKWLDFSNHFSPPFPKLFNCHISLASRASRLSQYSADRISCCALYSSSNCLCFSSFLLSVLYHTHHQLSRTFSRCRVRCNDVRCNISVYIGMHPLIYLFAIQVFLTDISISDISLCF